MLALLAVMVAASPNPRVAAPAWSGVNVTDKESAFFVDYLAHELGQHQISVTTSSEMAALIGFERQRQLLGCANDSSTCAAELAGALGVGSILIGSLAKFDSGYVINLKLVTANEGRQLASYTERLGSTDALLDYLARVAKQLSAVARGEAEPAPVASRRPFWLIPAGVGVASLVTGVVLEVLAHAAASDIAAGNPMYLGKLDASISAASTNQTLGWTFIGVAGACAVAALVLLLVGASP